MPQTFDLSAKHTNQELEAELLHALIENPATYDVVSEWAGSPEVWATYREEFISVTEAITRNEKPTIATALQVNPSGLTPLEIAKELADLYQRRRLARTYQTGLHRLYQDTDISANELIAQAEKDLYEARSAIKALELGQIQSATELSNPLLDDLRTLHAAVRADNLQLAGIPTGFQGLDDHLGGLQAGIHLLAAEPGAGKTTLALQIARSAAKEGIPSIFVTFEETHKRLLLKHLCALGGKDFKRYAEGWGKPEDLANVVEEHKSLLDHMYFIQGRKDLSVAEVQAKTVQLMRKYNTDKCLIIIDYLQRWAAHYQSGSDFRFIVRKLAADLRDLSLRYNIPLLVISSQNRSGQGEAKLSSFKESGDLEYDADSALFLVKDKNTILSDGEKAIDLRILKNRYGEADRTIKLTFFGAKGYFVEPIQ